MELVRIVVQGPTEGSIWVIAVPPASTVVDLTTVPYAGLLDKLKSSTPLVLEANGADVFYRFSSATGVVSDLASTVPTAVPGVAGVKFAGQQAVQADSFPNDVRYLMVKTATATGYLRVRPVG